MHPETDSGAGTKDKGKDHGNIKQNRSKGKESKNNNNRKDKNEKKYAERM